VRVKPHRYSQPNRTIRRLDGVAIDEAVAFELNVVENDKDIAPGDTVEESQPRQLSGLMDGIKHPDRSVSRLIFKRNHNAIGAHRNQVMER
jgi:hypothetical protein